MTATSGHDSRAVLPALPLQPARRRLRRWQVIAIFTLPLALIVYQILVSYGVTALAANELSQTAAAHEAGEPSGALLYSQHCARCHGERGTADGITSMSLDPPARRFGEERFQLSTTINGIPSDDDLDYVIRHGIPGTAMPDFAFLNDVERRAIIGHLRVLTQSGTYTKLYQRAVKDDEVDITELARLAAKQVQPGPAFEVPADSPAMSPESIARGAKIFAANCATCHGPSGAGDGPQVKGMKNDNGVPTKPRDLARGVFKGGGEPHRLYIRTALGMPGTPMPASGAAIKPNDIGDLVNFVLSLSKPKT